MEEFKGVSGSAFDEPRMEGFDKDGAGLLGEFAGVLNGGLKVFPVLDELDALGLHREIFFTAVTVRDDDDGFEPQAARGEPDTLAVVAACGGDERLQTRIGLLEPCGVDEGAAQLESSERRVIFMLEPELDGRAVLAKTLVEQRPGVLRRGRHYGVDKSLGGFDLRQGGQTHNFSLRYGVREGTRFVLRLVMPRHQHVGCVPIPWHELSTCYLHLTRLHRTEGD